MSALLRRLEIFRADEAAEKKEYAKDAHGRRFVEKGGVDEAFEVEQGLQGGKQKIDRIQPVEDPRRGLAQIVGDQPEKALVRTRGDKEQGRQYAGLQKIVRQRGKKQGRPWRNRTAGRASRAVWTRARERRRKSRAACRSGRVGPVEWGGLRSCQFPPWPSGFSSSRPESFSVSFFVSVFFPEQGAGLVGGSEEARGVLSGFAGYI